MTTDATADSERGQPAGLPLNDGLGAGVEARKPLNGIARTMFHDEGAYARCSCGWYSLNPATLSDKRPPCWGCGDVNGWSGSFVKPGPGAKWSGLVQPASA